MSYLDAPSTQMLATHCCVCGRALRDAKSVELGIGPECGEHLHALDQMGEDQRKLANQLIHAASVYASQGKVSEVRRCADALKVIGLEDTSELVRERFKNAERLARLYVTEKDGRLYIKAPFRRGDKDAFVAAWRAIPGRRWDPLTVSNVVPKSERPAVWALFLKFFPGVYGESDEGIFRVPGGD